MSSSNKCPIDYEAAPSRAEECPVNHKTRSSWSELFTRKSRSPSVPKAGPSLSTERDISSIPKGADGNWVYPSEAQFFAAMARKNHNPQASDMKTIVPIHNAVNERAWAEVVKWEAGRGGENCGGVKLVNFQGKPGQRSWRATWRTFLGYSPPFDRHDWVIDRCGARIRYIIDFYTGRNEGTSSTNLSFFLDVRPALDNWEGVKMRAERFWYKLLGGATSGAPTPQSTRPST